MYFKIVDTMRYPHFAPDHLDDAITKNPIAELLGKNEMTNASNCWLKLVMREQKPTVFCPFKRLVKFLLLDYLAG
ncbi:hypothetical protein GCM10007978_20130 [Shewanella hanedai]|nr:hypothetical protein GCM10007978_20130 [Shewanella hanedai]